MIRGLIVVSAYVAAQMVSNIASLKIVLFFGLSMDAGTFVYPLTFTLRDLVHKFLGIAAARATIVIAVVINLLMAVFFWIVAQIPGDPSVGPQLQFAAVLSPVWRIVFASITAQLLSELIDTEAYRVWVAWIGHKWQWTRVLFSNSISVPVDSLLFAFIAFWGRMPIGVVWAIVLSNILLKGATTLVSLPLIYAVPEKGGKVDS